MLLIAKHMIKDNIHCAQISLNFGPPGDSKMANVIVTMYIIPLTVI